MKKITINNGLSTKIKTDFDNVNYIEVDDEPFATGGFGKVYNCTSINGRPPTNQQVVKIFMDNGNGSARLNYTTTQRLQKKLHGENDVLLSNSGKNITDTFPALKGVPQYSFEGVLEGIKVLGFTSNNLTYLGFEEFKDYLQPQLVTQYQQIPIQRKMLMAYHLASAFKLLESFHFIHADLKPEALFVNLQANEIAIIDFDSGVITENPDDEPSTWGAGNDWVAPEIWEQQSNLQHIGKINVDVYSDRWSVAIGIHYILTTFHPLFYLKELSPKVAKQYLNPPSGWPYVDKNATYFEKDNEEIYDNYLNWITSSAIPEKIRNEISHTINYGYSNSTVRTSYSKWQAVLQDIQKKPKIKVFDCSDALIKGTTGKLIWKIEDAHTVIINNGIGQVGLSGTINIRPSSDIKYEIRAIGYFGEVSDEANVRVFPTPVIESLKIPMPDFQSKIVFERPHSELPKIDLSVNLPNLSLKIPNYADYKLDLTEPSIELKTLRPIKERKSIFNLSYIYDTIKNRILNQQDEKA